METADERRGQGSGAGDEDVTASINDAAQLARREWCTERQVNLTLSLAFLALKSSRQRSKDVSINIERLCDPDPELGHAVSRARSHSELSIFQRARNKSK
jgi:hypothetical protein